MLDQKLAFSMDEEKFESAKQGKTEKGNFEIETDYDKALEFVQQFEFDGIYADWAHRVPEFLDQYRGNRELMKIKDAENNPIGFCLVSSDKGKLMTWSRKFQNEGWIKKPIEIEKASQFAYFFIKAGSRGSKYGTKVITEVKDYLKKQGKTKLYGFTRYSQVVKLYQRTGAEILNQSENMKNNQIWTYYYWDLSK